MKAQVGMFLIIGVVLLVGMGVVFFTLNLASIDGTSAINNENRQAEERQEAIAYVESCIEQSVSPLIEKIMEHGGTLSPQSNIIHRGSTLNVLATYQSRFGYRNEQLDLNTIEKEIATAMTSRLKNCIDSSVFRIRGFTPTLGEPAPTVAIADNKVSIDVEFPITLEKPAYTITLSSFTTTMIHPLGVVYHAVMDIINEEVSTGTFSPTQFMLSHPAFVIHKTKPYPHVIYDVVYQSPSGNYSFSFALEGMDTVVTEPLVYMHSGCCTDQATGACWKNVDMLNCPYTHDPNNACTCDAQLPVEVTGCCRTADQCVASTLETCSGTFIEGDIDCSSSPCQMDGCEHTYNYVSDDYSGPPRAHGESWCVFESMAGKGLDYVGTQHYVHSCVDGKEYVETCRDFREELCASEITEEGFTKRSTSICRVNRWFDCADQSDQASCEDTTKRDCTWGDFLWWKETKCHPNVPPGSRFWEGQGANVCQNAHFDLDEWGEEYPKGWGYSSLMYCQRSGDCGNYRNRADKLTEQGYYNPDQDAPEWIYWEDGYHQRGDEYLVRGPYSIPPPVQLPEIATGPVRGYAQCDIWKAPFGNCELCESSSVHPCTEYKCKSLGSNCEYNPASQRCGSRGSLRVIPPVITDISFTNGFTARKQRSVYYDGTVHQVVQPVQVYQPLQFTFSTDQPTRCRLSTRPKALVQLGVTSIAGVQLPEIFLNDNEFLTSYAIELRLPSASFTERDDYLVFLRCKNEQGVENEVEQIIGMRVSEPLLDTFPPRILNVTPSIEKNIQQRVTLYMNEPVSQCRYGAGVIAYDQMTNMSCFAEDVDVTYNRKAPLGSYPCTGIVDVGNVNGLVFVCEDLHGNKNQHYVLSVT